MRDHLAFARREGVLLDPVYTGKAFRGLVGEARAGRVGREGGTVFLHTGGVFGLFAFAGDMPG
jgi:1-aminocyclopropane-1-carboxylate deaminase/D-cysteine desulfhydrase-like pyridoxal-dependent ACC family enzyme